ncbi:iron ABC transporter permease, partial [Salmonella enterica]
AYVWADVLAPSGPIRAFILYLAPQSTILQISGPTGPWAVGIVLGLVLYPYVYLPARAAFEAQAANSLEAARSLGASP